MVTLRELVVAIQRLDEKLLDLPVRSVTQVREIERGPLEGAVVILNKPVVGVALTTDGLFLFSKEDTEPLESYMAGLPPGFQTGNPEIDSRLKGIEPGDEWKNNG